MRPLVATYMALLLLVACRPAAVSEPPSGAGPDDAAQIMALLRAEAAAVVAQDMDALAGLWAEDAAVTDAKHTPDEPSDDAMWRGIDAILDRYVVLVFPGNPQFIQPTDVIVDIEGNRATARSTTQINDEVSPDGDLWTFVRRDGRWYIHSLTYNLEPPP